MEKQLPYLVLHVKLEQWQQKHLMKKMKHLKTFGLKFWHVFSIIDDAIDYSSSFYHLGKNIGDDFKQGKVTLPIILAYLRSNNEEKKYWKRTMQDLNQKK